MLRFSPGSRGNGSDTSSETINDLVRAVATAARVIGPDLRCMELQISLHEGRLGTSHVDDCNCRLLWTADLETRIRAAVHREDAQQLATEENFHA